MSEDNRLQCYNRSCGQMFDPVTNKEDSCVHHPGVPVFHDAYKKWSCCDKKTTDFTEFLNIKGCTRSYHSNVKPPEPVKEEQKKMEVVCPPSLEQRKRLDRPDPSQPLVRLPHTVGSSLKAMIEKMGDITLAPETINDSTVKLDSPCLNMGCHKGYKGEHSNTETCLHHTGYPVFHEGMKYWSCCVRKTTDFDHFLEQVGCTTGKHKWKPDKDETQKKIRCRYDWHQVGAQVVVSVYCKCPRPDVSIVEVNPVRMRMRIEFGPEGDVFEEEVLLHGVIDVDGSSVTYLGTKVEIKLKKAEPVAWKELATKTAAN